MLEVPHNVDRADVGPEDHAAEPEEEDEAVLPQPPPAPAEVVPVARSVDDGRGHEGQRGHLDGTDQGDEEVQPGHGGGLRVCSVVSCGGNHGFHLRRRQQINRSLNLVISTANLLMPGPTTTEKKSSPKSRMYV